MQRHKHLMSLISDLFPNLFAKILQLYKLISVSDFVEDAFARQCKQKNEFLFCIVLTYSYLCIVHTHAFGRMGGTATYWKASLMLCF